MSQYPDQLKYTKDHEWTLTDGKVVTVGVTDHAQSALGDIVFVELPEVGRDLSTGDTFGVVESIKAVSDLYSPVSGKVKEVNSALSDDPSQINTDPHGGAWIIKVEVDDASALGELMDSKAYQEYIAGLE